MHRTTLWSHIRLAMPSWVDGVVSKESSTRLSLLCRLALAGTISFISGKAMKLWMVPVISPLNIGWLAVVNRKEIPNISFNVFKEFIKINSATPMESIGSMILIFVNLLLDLEKRWIMIVLINY